VAPHALHAALVKGLTRVQAGQGQPEPTALEPDESVVSPEVLGLGSTTGSLPQTSQLDLEALFSKVQPGQLHF